MSDRSVRQIAPLSNSDDTVQRRPFSEYSDQPNIVLLGDPGAGKSHLFNEFAQSSGGTFLSARTFLNTPSFSEYDVLFIDALDEKRSGRGDQDTIDAMVQKLFHVGLKKVRISCRERDWLGETDLAAFRPYFEKHGGIVVLGLEPLSENEQRAVLKMHGMADPDSFLTEAATRGLEDFLVNPQNLIMLAKTVESGNWPTTRKELFETFTLLLLEEHNSERSRSGDGVFTADELRDAAGAVCATRLIADVEGISLTERDSDPDFPSYRSLGFMDTEKVRAALGRRVFISGGAEESVEYVHRTIAEYLAAGWLARRVRGGLPVGRIQALIGIDGQPASELRGLHAWLAVLLPEHADALIDADAYGVLTYGDAASLTRSTRRRLLEALARLSETDPWFRHENWSSPAIGALSTSDMADAFSDILRSDTSNFGIRSLVIDALASGAPPPALQPDLLQVLCRHKLSYAERVGAFTALMKMGETAKRAVIQIYRDRLGRDAAGIRLRGEILSALYGDGFGAADVATLLDDTLTCDDELPGGALWFLPRSVPPADIATILDTFEPRERRSRSHSERRNNYEVSIFFDRLLLRLLQELRDEIPADKLWKWLIIRRAFGDMPAAMYSKEIKYELEGRPDLLHAITNSALESQVIDERKWGLLHRLREATLHSINDDDLLEWVAAHISLASHEGDKEAFLYQLALYLSLRDTPRANLIFESLYDLGEARPDLTKIRDQTTSCIIEDWRLERGEESAQWEAERSESREKKRSEFDKEKSVIRGGMHLGWLGWVASIYFGRFTDVDQTKAPHGRLVDELGEEKAEVAIEGLLAVLDREGLPSLDAVVQMVAEGKYYEWWYAIIAGLDERWNQTPDLKSLPDELLKSALAIDLLHPTFDYDDNVRRRKDRDWKSAAFQSRPELVRDSYVAVAQAELQLGADYVDGLYELLNNEAFMPFRREISIRFLKNFPNASPPRLQELLCCALGVGEATNDLLSIARDVLGQVINVDADRRDLWVSVAYLLSPQEFQPALAEAASRPDIVWLLRDMANCDRRLGGRALPILSVNQMEDIARITSQHFPNCSPPSEGWTGDHNAWDGAEFVQRLINNIAADPSDTATMALTRLVKNDSLITYRDHIKHALADQSARHREAEYRQPNWVQTVAALSDGAPANVPDLHAILIAHLKNIKSEIVFTNTDIYKRFWNENGHGKIETPKHEESCRDVLVDLLRARLRALGVIVEPEGHMAGDRRADISVSLPAKKILVELKRDYHAEVWVAAEEQLDRFYTQDPEATGFGVYGVFWFGKGRTSQIRTPPNGSTLPKTASEMEDMLQSLIPAEKRSRLAVVVIDVSGPPR
jgi:hypothetical protein